MVLLIVGLRAFIWLKDTFPSKRNSAIFYRTVQAEPSSATPQNNDTDENFYVVELPDVDATNTI